MIRICNVTTHPYTTNKTGRNINAIKYRVWQQKGHYHDKMKRGVTCRQTLELLISKKNNQDSQLQASSNELRNVTTCTTTGACNVVTWFNGNIDQPIEAQTNRNKKYISVDAADIGRRINDNSNSFHQDQVDRNTNIASHSYACKCHRRKKTYNTTQKSRKGNALDEQSTKSTHTLHQNIGTNMPQHKAETASNVSPSTETASHRSPCMIYESHTSPTNHVRNRDVMKNPMTLHKNPKYKYDIKTSRFDHILINKRYMGSRNHIYDDHRKQICPYSMLTYKKASSMITFKIETRSHLPTTNTTDHHQLKNNRNTNSNTIPYHSEHTIDNNNHNMNSTSCHSDYTVEDDIDPIEIENRRVQCRNGRRSYITKLC